MTKKANKGLLDGLVAAMRAEHEGEHFYRMAASVTKDPQGREVLAFLADEEKAHAAFLAAQYRAIAETGKPDTSQTLGAPRELDGANPIFSEALRKRLDKAQYEMTILSVAIQLELSAKEQYEKLARKATDPAVQGFYRELAAWELGHYRALLQEQDNLREDYWAKAGFSPF